MAVLLNHFHVALFYGQGHFALAHVFADNCVAGVDGFFCFSQNLLVVLFASAESRRSEQEDFLVVECFQQIQGVFVRGAFVSPEADEKQFRCGVFPVRADAEIVAVFLRQCIVDGVGQQLCVARYAAEDD